MHSTDPAPTEVRGYISDMLSVLADMARSLGETRIEHGIRALALEVIAKSPADAGDPGEAGER